MRKIFFVLFVSITTVTHAAHETCGDCHVNAAPQSSSAALLAAVPQICIQCHADRVAPGEHRIDVAPGNDVPPSLPLVNGLVSCTTCHAPHLDTPDITRLAPENLCGVCHPQ
jgi:predicted CXXCH cytochrome family protein